MDLGIVAFHLEGRVGNFWVANFQVHRLGHPNGNTPLAQTRHRHPSLSVLLKKQGLGEMLHAQDMVRIHLAIDIGQCLFVDGVPRFLLLQVANKRQLHLPATDAHGAIVFASLEANARPLGVQHHMKTCCL